MRRLLIAPAFLVITAPVGTAAMVGQDNIRINVSRSPCTTVIVGPGNRYQERRGCARSLPIRAQLHEMVENRNVDPLLLRLISRADLDGALRRIEVLTSRPTPYAALYLSVAATIASQESLSEGVRYSRRAYEADPHYGLAIVGYAGMLSLDHQERAAYDLVTQAYRQRDLLRGIGRVHVELAWLDITYPATIRETWVPALVACYRDGRCPVAPEVSANILALRGAARELVRRAVATEPNSRASLRAQYHGWRYILICDVLLRNRQEAAADEAAMLQVVRNVSRRSGAWGVLSLLPDSLNFDLHTHNRHLVELNNLFQQALHDAPTAPVAPLANNLPEERWLPNASALMLGVSRRFWVSVLLRQERFAEAWTESIRSIEEARSAGDVGLAIASRAITLKIMISIPDMAGRAGGVAFVRDEYRLLQRALMQKPRLRQEPAGEHIRQLGSQLCEGNIIPEAECRASVGLG